MLCKGMTTLFLTVDIAVNGLLFVVPRQVVVPAFRGNAVPFAHGGEQDGCVDQF